VRPILADLHDVPVDGGSVDTVISLAGLHHVADRPAVFREMRRMLKPETGRACIADVAAGSPIATFLNGFVDRHNSMGHHGEFIDDGIRREIVDAGFRITSDTVERFQWLLPSEPALARFCKLLFGLDRADERQTLDALREHVGYEHANGQWRLNWELTFIETAGA
jgi:SAM-dependent methyltransferase